MEARQEERQRRSYRGQWYVPRDFFGTERWLYLSVHALCPTGTKFDGEFKEDKLNGRGILTLANGMCHVTVLGLSAGPASASMHSALQERAMTANSRMTCGMAQAFIPGPMVRAK